MPEWGITFNAKTHPRHRNEKQYFDDKLEELNKKEQENQEDQKKLEQEKKQNIKLLLKI